MTALRQVVVAVQEVLACAQGIGEVDGAQRSQGHHYLVSETVVVPWCGGQLGGKGRER